MFGQQPPKKSSLPPSRLIDDTMQALFAILDDPAEMNKLSLSEKDSLVLSLCKLTLPTELMRWLEVCEELGVVSFNKKHGMTQKALKYLQPSNTAKIGEQAGLDEIEWNLMKLFFSLKKITTCLVDKNATKYPNEKMIHIFHTLEKLSIIKIEIAEENNKKLMKIAKLLAHKIASKKNEEISSAKKQTSSSSRETTALNKATGSTRLFQPTNTLTSSTDYANEAEIFHGIIEEPTEVFSEEQASSSNSIKSSKSKKEIQIIRPKKNGRRSQIGNDLLSGSEDDEDINKGSKPHSPK